MISIITTCVNYSDFLSITYKYNKQEFEKNYYLIVTSKKDKATQEFCIRNSIDYYETNAFYKGGAYFNKANAINEAFMFLKEKIFVNEWILLCDADVVVAPAVNYFVNQMEHKDANCLYSVGRHVCNNMQEYKDRHTKYDGCEFIGFFQLFHKKHIVQHLETYSWFLPSYDNCSGYDVEFMKKFKCREEIHKYPALHLGQTHINWYGRKSKPWDTSE